MATVTAPRNVMPDVNFDANPAWWRRISPRGQVALVLFVVTSISVFMRTRIIGGQFWMDEALSVGISSHALTAITGVLHHAGSPPLYYMLLNVWMTAFGSGETATHLLSLLFVLLSIPVGMLAAWSLFGRRSRLFAAVLFGLNPFITA